MDGKNSKGRIQRDEFPRAKPDIAKDEITTAEFSFTETFVSL